jgi:hypothetical protein
MQRKKPCKMTVNMFLQSLMVNNGPSSHGSQNCSPSPQANSDDSGGDCVNEPKLGHHGLPPAPFSAPPGTPPVPPYGSDFVGGLAGKPVISASVMSRSLTAARRGKKSKHRDPNEPQKPVSAYALFFRDMQVSFSTEYFSGIFSSQIYGQHIIQ